MHLKDICRLCLIKSSKTSEELFFPIDDAFENKFNEVTNLIFHKSEDAPGSVCISCLTELETYFNYRCGLIAKQKRLNVLLGIKNDYEHPVKLKEDPKVQQQQQQEPSSIYIEEAIDEHQVVESENEIEQFEEQEIVEIPEEVLMDSEDPVEEEEVVSYEQVYRDDSEYEMEQEYQQEENEDQDSKYYYVKEEEDQGGEEDYLVIDGPQPEQPTPSTSAEKPKRKYVKQSKDSAKPFKCWMENCTAVFSFRATMRKHMLSAHQVVCDKSTCLICGSRFEEYNQFLAHVKIHTRKAECDICKLRFINDEKMQAHRDRVHVNDLDERCFPCGFCNALFKRREHVNSHILYKHTSDKAARRFHCKECPTSFLTRQDMKNHEKSHRQVMIKCCYCDYECRDLKSIRRHCEKFHDTLKIYKCQCSALFEMHKDLQAHKKSCNEIVDSTTEN